MRSRHAILCLICAVAQQHFRAATAQIYPLKRLPVPGNRSLHTLYAFYVYSEEEAPDKSLGAPFVKFSGLYFEPTSAGGASADLAAYAGVQLSIMRYKDFWALINPRKFCSTPEDVARNRANATDQLMVQIPPSKTSADVDVYMHMIRFSSSSSSHTKDEKIVVRRSGVYILVFSNCGNFSDAVVTGTVIMKNAYGFLPGNEYYKMPFYGWLLVVYVGLALAWLMLSLRWWKELFNIQTCIAAVIFFGLLEAFLWYLHFNDWNTSGTRGTVLFILAILFTVVKSTFSYMLVLVASLGWGVTRPFLEKHVVVKIQVLCVCYIVLDFIRETVLSFRHSHSLSLAFVFLCLLPVSLLNGAIFYWVFTALSSLMETLRERRQSEKLLLFQRLWKILIAALGIATFTLLFQIFNLSRSITARWKHQWLLTDGVSHVLFLFVLASMMYLLAPHKYSQRYAYSQQIDGNDDELGEKAPENAGTLWADEDEADDGESFWAATKGAPGSKVKADVIGASEEEMQGSLEKIDLQAP